MLWDVLAGEGELIHDLRTSVVLVAIDWGFHLMWSVGSTFIRSIPRRSVALDKIWIVLVVLIKILVIDLWLILYISVLVDSCRVVLNDLVLKVLSYSWTEILSCDLHKVLGHLAISNSSLVLSAYFKGTLLI